MAQTSLGLGSGSRVGSWGLRQTKDIISLLPGVPYQENPAQIWFYSPSGEVVSILTAGKGNGAKLNLTWTESKVGGLINFELVMLKDIEIPFFQGMVTRLYFKNAAWIVGFLDVIPDTDVDSDTIKLKGKGFSQKLKDLNFTQTYTNITPDTLIEQLALLYFADLDIGYNPTKIRLPSFLITKVIFDDRSLWEAMETLRQIMNFEYQTAEYAFGVDAEQDFYFKGMDNGKIQRHYFEGYDYQAPEVELTTDELVNKILMYRTKETSGKEAEYIDTYSDTDSIDRFGTFEAKVMLPDFISDDEADKLAAAIFAEKSVSKKRISISDFAVNEHLNIGYYALSNKRDFQRYVVSEFTAASEWTQSLTTSTISIVDTRVFSGRLCYKWEIDNSSGDKISLTLADPIYTPRRGIIYLRHSAAIQALKITYFGVSGQTASELITESGGDAIVTEDSDKIVVFTPGTDDTETSINNLLVNDWIGYKTDFTNIFKITGIEIEVITSGTVDILLDRLEIYTNSYRYNALSLEKIQYAISDSSVKAEADFGINRTTVISEVEDIDKNARSTYNIFAKT